MVVLARALYIGSIVLQALLIGYHLITAAAVRRRPTVDGTVTAADVQARWTGHGTDHVPHVAYRYVVAGVTYTCTRFWWIEHCYDDEQAARKALRGLTVGNGVRVRYDPANPRDAVVRVQSGRVLSIIIWWPLQIMLLEAMIRGPHLFDLIAMWVLLAFCDVVLVLWLWRAVHAQVIEEGSD
jgi:hypothetical protein